MPRARLELAWHCCSVGEERLELSIRKRSDILSVVRIPVPPLAQVNYFIEAAVGFAPTHGGFADRSVTTSPHGQNYFIIFRIILSTRSGFNLK